MKLYETTSTDAGDNPKSYAEFASSADGASKARTRLKKAYQVSIETKEVEVPTTRTELIAWLNGRTAHASYVPVAVSEKLEA